MGKLTMTRRAFLSLGLATSLSVLGACGENGRDASAEAEDPTEKTDKAPSEPVGSATAAETPNDKAAEFLDYLERKYPEYDFVARSDLREGADGTLSQEFTSSKTAHETERFTVAWSAETGFRDGLYERYHRDLLIDCTEGIIADGAGDTRFEMNPVLWRNDEALMPEEVGEDADPIEVLSRFELGDSVTVYVAGGQEAFDRIVASFEGKRLAYDLTGYLFADFPSDLVFYSGSREGRDYEIVSAKKDLSEYGEG